jgi:hypothetical protein
MFLTWTVRSDEYHRWEGSADLGGYFTFRVITTPTRELCLIVLGADTHIGDQFNALSLWEMIRAVDDDWAAALGSWCLIDKTNISSEK